MNSMKKRFHPCGGFFLQGALKWLVPANLLMIFIGAGMLSYDFYKNWTKWIEEKQVNQVNYTIRLGIWLVFVLHLAIWLPMDILLYRAVKHKNAPRLKFWSVGNFFNTILALSGYIARISHFGIHLPILLTPYCFYCIYKFYMSVVVYYYCLEVEEEEELRSTLRMLSETEMREFEEGILQSEIMIEQQTQSLIDKVQRLRYKREEFEIDMECLEIDENPLGNGSYGVVYRATYLKAGEYQARQVAVKTFESGFMDALCFKALLAELKVMTYLGHHEHILKLLGAVTTQIKMRRLHMVLELCPFGCLLDYLRASRASFTSLVNDGKIIYDMDLKVNNDLDEDMDKLTTLDLMQWTTQVASGMAYLEDMKVVHGDLAARNLLLTETKKIKIADFGLARQLYQYSVYVKRQNVPLPWRWLALESIIDMNFSIKSDVWSFGVVAHEIFTLGEVPYENVKQFTLEFIENIRNGMRLENTPFCPDIIYRYMLRCWDENPDLRPSFHDLYQKFASLMREEQTYEEEALCTNSNEHLIMA